MAKIDILCKFQSLDGIIEKYGTAIDRLTIAFYDLEAVCDEMEEGQYWLGDAHEAYVKLYAEWREDFLRKLAGLIVFQSALNCVQESLQSVLNARNDLSNDISVSGSTSPISADSDSSNVLRIHYAQATSAEYEIESSNPRFLDEIINLLSDAKLEVNSISSSDYPKIEGVSSSITNFCNDLKSERLRYTGFAGSYYSFCNGIQAMEGMLNSTIDSMFTEHLAGMDSDRIETMVKDYAQGSFSYDLSNLGISQTDALLLIELQLLCEGGDYEENAINELCDRYREKGATKELLAIILRTGLKDLSEEQVNSVILEGIELLLGKTTNLSAKELAKESAKIATEITRLSGKADAVLLKMGKKIHYYAEDGYYKARLRKLQESIDALVEKDKMIEQQIDATVKYNKWSRAISWTFIGVEVAVEGFRSRVINGMDWDDVWQDMADEAVAGIGTYAAASIITFGLSKSAVFGAYAGPIGVSLGLAVGVYLEIKEPLHGFFEEATDWWDMLCW